MTFYVCAVNFFSVHELALQNAARYCAGTVGAAALAKIDYNGKQTFSENSNYSKFVELSSPIKHWQSVIRTTSNRKSMENLKFDPHYPKTPEPVTKICKGAYVLMSSSTQNFITIRLRFFPYICEVAYQMFTRSLVTPPRYGSGVLRSVCLSVCSSASISLESLDRSSRNVVCKLPYGRGSVLLRRRCDTLCTSGFIDDVTFGHSGPYGDAWKAKPLTYYSTTSGVAIPGQNLMSMNALFCAV